LYPKIRPTSGCSRIATAPFFKYFLLAKWVYNVTGLAHPQSAEPRALGGEKNAPESNRMAKADFKNLTVERSRFSSAKLIFSS
jgi:hypothetical protein